MGPPPIGAPDAKRQRTGGLVLEPEEEFLAKYPGPSKVLHFACPLRSTCIHMYTRGYRVYVFCLHGTYQCALDPRRCCLSAGLKVT